MTDVSPRHAVVRSQASIPVNSRQPPQLDASSPFDLGGVPARGMAARPGSGRRRSLRTTGSVANAAGKVLAARVPTQFTFLGADVSDVAIHSRRRLFRASMDFCETA